MEWLKPLRGTTVALDTAPLIYFIEENRDYLPLVKPFFQAMERGDFSVVTSSLTLCEVLVQSFRKGNARVAAQYRQILLSAANLVTVDISAEIAEAAARLRAAHHLRTPDAIQLATAVHEGASAFLTNDAELVSVSGLRVLVLKDLR